MVMERFAILGVAMLVAASVEGGVSGYRPHPHPLRHLTNAVSRAANGRPRLRVGQLLPEKYDLRDVDGESSLSPVRNQGNYGACWAFAAMAGIEWLMRRDEGIDADLSENNLVNMHGFAAGFDDGGNGSMATAVLLREDAPVAEALDPYPHPGASVRERGVRIPRKVVFVPRRSSVLDDDQRQADLDAIKRALMDYGPLSTCYRHEEQYMKGAAYYCTVSKQANHAVSIVGWDDNYAASNFKVTPPGDGAFIIRNSWGNMYEAGYQYISYYDRTLGFDDVQVAYSSLSDGAEYGKVYQHDPYGYIHSQGYNGETVCAANMFVAASDELLVAFGFYALTADTSYSVYVVRNAEMSGGILNGDWISVKNGICYEAGYEVLPFNSPVAVTNAERFAIVVKMTSPGRTEPLAVCCNENWGDGTPFQTNVVAHAGQSFSCPDYDSYYWDDISQDGAYFCCKVYAEPHGDYLSTTTTDTPVPYRWLDSYVGQNADPDYFLKFYCNCYNALAAHVAANGLSIGESYARGIDPDNADATNLTATISFDASGEPVIGAVPRNAALWDYTVMGSGNLRDWHVRTAGDRFFKVTVQPK